MKNVFKKANKGKKEPSNAAVKFNFKTKYSNISNKGTTF